MEDLRRKYFFSVGRGVKLQGSLLGWYTNADMDTLYEQCTRDKVDIEQWPKWITSAIESTKQLM